MTTLLSMPRKKRESDFGSRLVRLRKARGFTQEALATAIGCTHRAISYYENEAAYPPAPVVADIAKALRVSIDELMGAVSQHEPLPLNDPETQKAWRRFRKIMSLPEKDQKAVMHMVNGLIAARQTQNT